MIVWIDGAFGSGKTTLVAELHRQGPEALVFDAEQISYILREIVEVPTGTSRIFRCGASRSPPWRSNSSRSTDVRCSCR
jgi:hypothetical protein